MKYIFTLLFILKYSISLIGQTTCAGGNYTSQQQIDNFPLNNPGCTVVQYIRVEQLNGNIITNLNGFAQIKQVTGTLNIQKNNQLINLSGLDSLQNIGDFEFFYNPRIKNMDELNQVDSITGYFFVFGNDSLMNLNGLNDVFMDSIHSDVNWVDDFTIQYNPQLSICANAGICSFLQNAQGQTITVSDNATDCNSSNEILSFCQPVSSSSNENFTNPTLKVFPNPTKNVINILQNTKEIEKIEVINIQGDQVLICSKTINAIDLSNVAKGTYIIKLGFKDKSSEYHRVIVE